MKKEDELKELVKRRYDELALNSDSLKCGCCCGHGSGTTLAERFYHHERRLLPSERL